MISKKVAAVEVAKWVSYTANTALCGFFVTLALFLTAMYELEGYDFVISAGGLGMFAFMFAHARKTMNYLKKKYNIR